MKKFTLILSLMAVLPAWPNDAKPAAAHGSEKTAEKKDAKPAAKSEHGAAAKAETKPAASAHGEAKKPEASHAEAKKTAPVAPSAHSETPAKPVIKAVVRAAAKPRVAPRAAAAVHAPPPTVMPLPAGVYPAGSYVLVPTATFMATQGVIPLQMMASSVSPPVSSHNADANNVEAHSAAQADHSPSQAPHHIAAPAGPPEVTAEEALNELKKGNERHVESDYNHENHSHRRLEEVAKGQKPHAVILTCSDSRLPPELIFDKGLGDLFVIRVAGNVAGNSELGSIEYAAEHLNVPLVIVMGHKRCGAVQAAASGGDPGGHISSLVKQIEPAVQRAKSMAGDLVDNAVHANVDLVVRNLRNSGPILKELVESGRLKVLGAYYDIDSGNVDWMY